MGYSQINFENLLTFYLKLLLNKNNFIFSHLQLSEIVNSVSPQGQLPLGIALMGRSTAIAQTLVQTGKADVNAYNAEVRSRSNSIH